jgi:transposase
LDFPPDSAEGVEALENWLAQIRPDGRCVRVVVEATGSLSRRVAHLLNPRGFSVAIINPRRSKALGDSLGVREKTDRIDCAILALYGLMHQPAPTRLRSAASEQVRELTRLRAALVKDRTAWLGRQSEASSEPARRVIDMTIKNLEKQIADLEHQIDRLLAEEAELDFQVRRLKQIKGIGPQTARTLTAELGDLRTYSRGQIVAACGLFPKRFDSGKSVHKRPRLAKGGGGRVRRVLYMAATSLFHSKGPTRVWIEQLCAQGREKMQVEVIVMRKLLLVARAVMLNDGHYEPSKILCQKV